MSALGQMVAEFGPVAVRQMITNNAISIKIAPTLVERKYDMTDLLKELEGMEQSALDNLKDAEASGEGIRLPFPVPYIFVINGDAKMKAVAEKTPALYFGGWATDADQMGELIDAGVIPEFPKHFVAYEGVSGSNTWNGLCGRTVTLSVVARRQRWLNKDGDSSPKFNKETGSTRRHVQILALVYSEGKPLGYCVVSAKGFQAGNLLGALKEWEIAISKHRKAINATTLPLSAFALTFGTAGDKPNFVSVGSGETREITPIQAIIPEDMSPEKVAKRFVGKVVLQENASRLEMAREWLEAWSTKVEQAHEEPVAEEF